MGLLWGELSTHRFHQQRNPDKCHQIPLPWHRRASAMLCLMEADAKEVENKLEKVHV